MPATAGTTTIEVPLPVKERLARLRQHDRQAYHEVIQRALDALEGRTGVSGLDALVSSKRKQLRDAAKRHRMARVWLFGSRSRGEARPDSDVDLLVQTDPAATLWDIGGFLADARDILGVKVDVADLDGLKPEFRRRIVPEAVPI